MAAAKQAVGRLIDAIPDNVNVAVVVYGCDKSRGCDDIDLLQPLGRMDKAALKSKIMRLPNTGMTPIGASLNIAGKALKKAVEAHHLAEALVATDLKSKPKDAGKSKGKEMER